MLALGALTADVAAHVDGCHRWHSCPSDDGGYVCGDRGHCSECPDNQYCIGRRSRSAPAATATSPPRPTRTPEPTDVPRPTRTPAATAAARGPETSSAVRLDGATPVRGEGPTAGPLASPSQAGTGAPLAAALAPPRPAAEGTAPSTSPIVADLAGVRVLGPLQWTTQADAPAVAGVVHNSTDEARTLVLVLVLRDGAGAARGTIDVVMTDLTPGESRTFVQALPAVSVADVGARLEVLVPSGAAADSDNTGSSGTR